MPPLLKTSTLININKDELSCHLYKRHLPEYIFKCTGHFVHLVNSLLPPTAKIAKQGLAQVTVATASKEEKKLSVGLLGCLVNITGEVEGLKVLLQTESGRELLKTTCHLVIDTSADSSLAELAMMLLVNLLSAEHGLGTADPKTTLGIDLMTKVGVAAGR